MNEMDERYVMALNNHTEALEKNTQAMNALSAILEKIFSTGLNGSDLRSLGSLVSEVGNIATYSKNQMSEIADRVDESATKCANAASTMYEAANKNANAADEMYQASQRNHSAAEEMYEAACRR